MSAAAPNLGAQLNLRALRGEVWLSPEELQAVVSGADLPAGHLPRLMNDLLRDAVIGLRARGPAGAAGVLTAARGTIRSTLAFSRDRDQLEQELGHGRISPVFWTECVQLLLISALLSDLVDDHLARPEVSVGEGVLPTVRRALSFWHQDPRSGDAHLATRFLQLSGARDAAFMAALTLDGTRTRDALTTQTDCTPRALAWRGVLQGSFSGYAAMTSACHLLPQGHPAYAVRGGLDSGEREPKRRGAQHLSDLFDALADTPAPARIAPLALPQTKPVFWAELSRLSLPADQNASAGGERWSSLLWCVSQLSGEALQALSRTDQLQMQSIFDPWAQMITKMRPPWRAELERARTLSEARREGT